jgi:uncharacterized protein (TIGR02147 family)
MIDIFEYTDYRKYLSDVYAERKRENPAFSYKHIARKAGLNSKGFVYNIINGKKVLSKSNAFGISEALKHARNEAEYFENLVSFNQAKNIRERNHYFDRLCRIRTKSRGSSSKPMQLMREQFEFFSKWYHTIVRSLIDMYEFTDDYKWLSKMVNPPILPREAKQSVALLEKLGLIERRDDGVWRVTSKSVTTGREVSGLALENYHLEAAELAKRALSAIPSDQRDITGLILGISERSYHLICDEEADRVYHFNFHFYPVSEIDRERKKR